MNKPVVFFDRAGQFGRDLDIEQALVVVFQFFAIFVATRLIGLAAGITSALYREINRKASS
jgi:hypothetical protein